MTTLFVASLVFAAFVLAACALLLREQRASYERQLARLEGQNRDLMGRWYLSKNLPPAGTDLKARDEKRQADEGERRDRPRPSPSPFARAHATLATEEKKHPGRG